MTQVLDHSYFLSVASNLTKFPVASSSITFNQKDLGTVTLKANGKLGNPAFSGNFPPFFSFSSNPITATCGLSGETPALQWTFSFPVLPIDEVSPLASLSLKFPSFTSLFESRGERFQFTNIHSFEYGKISLLLKPAIVVRPTFGLIPSVSAQFRDWHFQLRLPLAVKEAPHFGCYFANPNFPKFGFAFWLTDFSAYFRTHIPGNGEVAVIVERFAPSWAADVRADFDIKKVKVAAAVRVNLNKSPLIDHAAVLAKSRFERLGGEVVGGWRNPDELFAEWKVPSGWMDGSEAKFSLTCREGKAIGAGVSVVINS